MTISSDDALKVLQHDVERLLGRCLLRLQQYELLMKALVAHCQISGPPDALEKVRAKRVEVTGRKTLGALVGDFLGSYIFADENGTSVEETKDSPEDSVWVNIRFHIELPEAEFDRIENDLKELVLLRNNLVHHFISQHDLGSPDGCRGAQETLVSAQGRINQQLDQLRAWYEEMEQCRRTVAEHVRSDVFHDLVVNGIAPDGTVDWPVAGAVSVLRQAAVELAVGGWTPVAEAGK